MECEEYTKLLELALTITITYMLVDLIYFGYKKYFIRKRFLDYAEPDPKSLTCYQCISRDTCPYVDDAYNTQGDCLYSK
jgi:hypothetical protein